MAFNIDILRQNTLDERSAEYKAFKKERIRGSYLTESQRREVHNAQKAMARNIKKTKRAIAIETNSIRRENLKERLGVLESLKEGMAQSSTIDGSKSYHPAASRIDAMDMFNKYFRDTRESKRTEEQAIEGVPEDLKLTEGQQKFLDRFMNKYGNMEFEGNFENTPTYEALCEELLKAIRAYDSDEAKKVASKIQHAYTVYHARDVKRRSKIARE